MLVTRAARIAMIAAFSTCMSASLAPAQQAATYTITPEFSAPFRCAPQPVARIQHVEGYKCTAPNGVGYSAAYPLAGGDFGRQTDQEVLRLLVQGSLQPYVRPKWEILQEFYSGRYPALSFHATHELPQAPGVVFDVYGIWILKSRGAYRWTVTGIVGQGADNARADFYALAPSVTLK